MLEEGLIITAMGMGTVLSFLIILIFSMVVMYTGKENMNLLQREARNIGM